MLPGASVTISGETGTRTTVSGSDGAFRFLNLDPGDYTVTVALSGFGTANRKVSVQTGGSATLDIALKVGSLSDTVEVVADAALVDVKKRGTSSNLTSQDLQDVPTARDPWGVMNQVPGAIIDRVNIAGNENGQQAAIAGKGSYSADVTWNLDGLVITDMAATGASPTYFDFGAFQEINVSTGGGDLTMQTGGFGLNMVTKRGTNQFHGGARYLMTDEKWQSSNIPAELATDARLKGGLGHCQAEGGANAFRTRADSITSIKDYGFDIGGPIVKDKPSSGSTAPTASRTSRTAASRARSTTLLPSYNAKINWQANSNTMVSAFYFLGSKQKFGRGAGLPGTNADGVTWNQDNAFSGWRPPRRSHQARSQPHVLQALHVGEGGLLRHRLRSLLPRRRQELHHQLRRERVDRFDHRLPLDPSAENRKHQRLLLFSSMGGNHELKFGFGYRDVTTNSTTHYNGNGFSGEYYGPGTGGGDNIAYGYVTPSWPTAASTPRSTSAMSSRRTASRSTSASVSTSRVPNLRDRRLRTRVPTVLRLSYQGRDPHQLPGSLAPPRLLLRS